VRFGDASCIIGEDNELKTARYLDRPDVAEAAQALRHMLNAVRAREVAAPAEAIARLQGAVMALEAVATGRMPDVDDLLVPGPYAF